MHDALLACDYGADAIGVIVNTPSPRRVSTAQAQKIFDSLPSRVKKVLVNYETNEESLLETALLLQPDFIQTPHAGLKQFNTMRVLTRFTDLMKRSDELFLLDLKNHGGVVHRLEFCSSICQAKEKIILAGGLTPQNVEKAIQETKPFGVDVCSGVEERTGVKSKEKLKAFCEVVKNA